VPCEFQFTCPLAQGIHARPASALEGIVRNFEAQFLLRNERNGREADLKSVLALISAEIRHNDRCRVSINGPDEEEALAVLSVFLREQFPHCDDALPVAEPPVGELPLPRSLRGTGAKFRRGTPAVTGIGCGLLVQAQTLVVPESIPTDGVREVAAEVRKMDGALTALASGYEERLRGPGSRLEVELLQTHLAVARDPEFRVRLRDAIQKRNRTIAGALVEVEAHFAATLNVSASLLLRERILDVRDVCFALVRQVYGKAALPAETLLKENSVVVAPMLTPEQFLALDRNRLKGLVLGHAGSTSHTIILASSFGIPTLTGIVDLPGTEVEGQQVVVDGELGALVTDLTEATRRYYKMEERRLSERRARQQRFARQLARTADGHRLEVGANISTAAEAAVAMEAGAEGVGLFRTEMLFMAGNAPPNEEEQFETYRQTVAAAAGRTVIFRTLDIGGDKPLSYLHLTPESNPLLGSRGVRLYPEIEPIFRTQIRALVRASAFGPLKLLVPMVTSLEEVRWVKRVIAEEQTACAAKGLAFDSAMPLGAMLEVPAAAFLLGALGRELDFFSIGSNDLLQAFAAADRTNPRLAQLSDPLQPAFLRLLQKIVAEAHAAGRWVGLCGEMGGQKACLPLLVGLGLDEVSAGPSVVPSLKAELAQWQARDCRQLTERALACTTAGEVRKLVEECRARSSQPLLEPELMVTDAESASKEEAIKTVVDRLYVLGRTEQPREVEEAVWQREAVYSTGFGHGFAIPHCKTNAVTANSLAVLKLARPVAWGSADGRGVQTIILLVIREEEAAGIHLKVFAQLARKLMHEDFREALTREQTPEALCAFLKESLGL
jgi:phosphoenolpyruvate-protein phosphotransferase